MRDWLGDLEHAQNGVLRACPPRQMEQAFFRYVREAKPQPALNRALAGCSREDLRRAARLLRTRVAALSPATHDEAHLKVGALAFASCLRTLSFDRPVAEPAAAREGPGDADSHAMRATEMLWHTAAALRAAKTTSAAARALTEGAAGLCEARRAVWWRREGNELVAAGALGFCVPPEGLSFRLTGGFWGDKALHREAVVELSAETPEHAALLARVEAERGVMVRLWEGHRWIGALSVHDGNFDEERRDLLAAIAEQGAATFRAVDLEQAREQAKSQHAAEGGFASALTTAANLEELLTQVCLHANTVASADACCLFLTDEDERLHLHTLCTLTSEEADQLGPDLEAVAARATVGKPSEVVWLNEAKLREAGHEALLEAGYLGALALSFVAREHPLGTLVLLARRPAAFGARVRQELAAFALQATATIENMQLFENAQRRLTEMSDLTWVSSRVASTLDPDSIAQTVSRAAADVLGVARVALFLTDEDGEFVPLPKGQVGFDTVKAQHLPAAGHLGAEALDSQSTRTVADAVREARTEDALVEWAQATSLLCAPMIAPQGLSGLFVVAEDSPRIFGLHTVTLLATYANQAALAFQSAMLYQHAVQHVRRLSRLGELSDALGSVTDPSQTASLTLKTAVELLDAPVGLIWLMNPEGSELELKAVHGLWPGEWAMQRLKPGEGLAGLAAQSGRPLVSLDVTRDGRFTYRRQARQKGLGAAVAAPLISRGRTVGVLNLYRKSPARFSDEDRRLLMSLASIAAVSIENTNLAREAQHRTEFVAAMMAEVNHRMRNSLQSVAGLLRMELERPQARSAEEVVRRAIAHVQAVAAVHEVIREQEVPFVDMKEAALRVVHATRGLLRDPSIDIQVTGARVLLPSQKAVSLALVLNELTDNAIRHGLAGRSNGRISVSLAEVGGEVVLQVRDNGVGMRGPIPPADSRGLGLQIVQGLVEQELGGTVEFEGRHGFTVRARFSKLQQSRDIVPL